MPASRAALPASATGERARADGEGQNARQESAVPELAAFFFRRERVKEMSAHELLRDRRSALRKNDRIIDPVGARQPDEAGQKSSQPVFPQDPGNSGVVDTAMREEVFVLRGENRIADNGGNAFIFGDRSE